MLRTLLCSLAGAAAGFLLSTVVISIAASGSRPDATDTTAIISLMGLLLAGMGAIAGAIVGGAADLREYFKRRDRESRNSQNRDE
jgi:hypothetical protein